MSLQYYILYYFYVFNLKYSTCVSTVAIGNAETNQVHIWARSTESSGIASANYMYKVELLITILYNDYTLRFACATASFKCSFIFISIVKFQQVSIVHMN